MNKQKRDTLYRVFPFIDVLFVLVGEEFEVCIASRVDLSARKIVAAHTDKRSRMTLVTDIAVCLVGKIGAIKSSTDFRVICTVKGVGVAKGKIVNVYTEVDCGCVSYAYSSHKGIVEFKTVADEYAKHVVSVITLGHIEIEEIIGIVHNRKSCHLLEIVGVKFHFRYSLSVVMLESAGNERLRIPGCYGISAVKS